MSSESSVAVIKTVENSQRVIVGTDSALSSPSISPSIPLLSVPAVTYVSQCANDAVLQSTEYSDASVMPRYPSNGLVCVLWVLRRDKEFVIRYRSLFFFSTVPSVKFSGRECYF